MTRERIGAKKDRQVRMLGMFVRMYVNVLTSRLYKRMANALAHLS